MKFYFDDWQAFWAMGAHGFYVWTCYAVVFAVILFLSFQPNWQLEQLKRQRRAIASRRPHLAPSDVSGGSL